MESDFFILSNIDYQCHNTLREAKPFMQFLCAVGRKKTSCQFLPGLIINTPFHGIGQFTGKQQKPEESNTNTGTLNNSILIGLEVKLRFFLKESNAANQQCIMPAHHNSSIEKVLLSFPI